MEHTLAVTDTAKMLQLGTVLGKDYKDFMRNNAYQANQIYAAIFVFLRALFPAEEDQQMPVVMSTTKQTDNRSIAKEKKKTEEINNSSENDP